MEFRDPEPIVTEGRSLAAIKSDIDDLFRQGHRADELRLLAGSPSESVQVGKGFVKRLPAGARLFGVLVI